MSEIRFNRWSHQSGTGGIYQNSSGSVGIGTSIPSSSLDIQGGDLKIGNYTLSSNSSSLNVNGDITVAGTLTYEDVTNIDSVGVVTARSGLHVTGGNVGIGTDNPTDKLHVYSSNGNTVSTIDSVGNDAALQLRNSGNGNWSGINFIRERSTGTNVTGGSIWMPSVTANNSALLYIQTQSASANAGVDSVLTDNNGVRLKLASQPNGVSADSAFSVEVGSQERLRVDSSGNIGIGTDNPIVYTANSKTLHIHGGSNPAEVRLTTSSSGVSQGTDGAVIQLNETSLAVWNVENDAIRFGTSDTERLRITSGGTLESYSPDDTTPNIKFRSDDTNWYGALNQSVEGGTITSFLSCGGDWTANGTTYSATKALAAYPTSAIAVHNQYNSTWGSEFVFLTKAGGSTTTDGAVTESLRIKNNGNIGIGTFSPNERVTITSGNLSSYIQLCDSSTGTAVTDGLFLGSYNGDAELKTKENKRITLGTSNLGRFVIDGSGNAEFTGTGRFVIRKDNSGGLGAYLSLQNRLSATGTQTGISFGVDNSDAIPDDGTDWGNGQITVTNDGTDGAGIMEFKVHDGSNNFSVMKMVGDGAKTVSTNNVNTAHTGGVAFGRAGISIDRGWENYPGIMVMNTSGGGDTNQGELRIHGWNRAYSNYPASSGSDFSVNLRIDGATYFGSDRRHKTNIVDNPYGLNQILQLQPRKFNRINSNGDIETDKGDILGFIAQEVVEVIPEAVKYYPDEDIPNEIGWCRAYALNDTHIVSTLVNAVKELSAKNDALEARIAALEGS